MPPTEGQQREAAKRRNAAFAGRGKAARVHNATKKGVATNGRSTGKKKNRRTSRAAEFGKRSFPFYSLFELRQKAYFGVWRLRVPRERLIFDHIARVFREKGSFSTISPAHSGRKGHF